MASEMNKHQQAEEARIAFYSEMSLLQSEMAIRLMPADELIRHYEAALAAFAGYVELTNDVANEMQKLLDDEIQKRRAK